MPVAARVTVVSSEAALSKVAVIVAVAALSAIVVLSTLRVTLGGV